MCQMRLQNTPMYMAPVTRVYAVEVASTRVHGARWEQRNRKRFTYPGKKFVGLHGLVLAHQLHAATTNDEAAVVEHADSDT